MHIEPRLLVFTKGVRARIAATVAVGLLGVGCGIARLGLLGWLIGQIFVGQPLPELVLPIRRSSGSGSPRWQGNTARPAPVRVASCSTSQ